MAKFDYVRAQSITEAIELLNEPDFTSRPLAGGTDLMVYLRLEKPRFDRLVDISRTKATDSMCKLGLKTA